MTATFAQQGFDDQASVELAFERGDDLTLLETSSAGSVQVLYGKNPQPTPCSDAGVCGRHFVDGQFGVDSTIPAALTGTFDGDVVTASGTGAVEFPFAYFGAIVKLSVQKPTIRFSQQEDGGVFIGVIAGTTPAATAKATLNGAALAHFSKQIQDTCTGGAAPDCGCASGSVARTAIDLFDVQPKDCVITLAEMNDNALISSLFSADQTVNGQPSLSLGYEFTVVPARFTRP